MLNNIYIYIYRNTLLILRRNDFLKDIARSIWLKGCILDEILNGLIRNSPSVGTCNFCHKKIKYWRRTGEENETKYSIIGNGIRMGRCPYCGSDDRSRWVYYILLNCMQIFERKGSVILHFAPEKNLEKEFRKNKNITYVTADIVKGRADKVVDLTNMPFNNESFDYIIANHVLEHILDEKKAINEIKRCLKSNGKFICSFPITEEIKTIESKDINDDKKRVYYYGQRDHVRLYGKDFRERLEAMELEVDVYSPQDILVEKDIEDMKLIKNDKVIICKKIQ